MMKQFFSIYGIMNIKKKELLHNLKNDIYCRIGVSKIHGVGVIAVKDISKNTNPFHIPGHKCIKYNAIDISKEELNKLDIPVKNLINDFIAENEDGSYSIPENGLNDLNISFYLNESKEPNLKVVETDCEFVEFITTRSIKAGEELTINYEHFK